MFGVMTSWSCLLCLLLLFSLSSSAGHASFKRYEHVCNSIDIRNFVEQFSMLENCTVIEGHLQILLIEFTTAEDFEHLSFPNLREITDYLLLYRIYGLRTLSHIFPNLSVIRGLHLYYNYALVVFEMPDLEELGLGSLMQIMRGAVRIEKNPRLCYIETIKWSALLSVNKADNFILQNKDIFECVNVCPRTRGFVCPQMSILLDSGEKYSQSLCWNANKCQIICPESCLSNNRSACYMNNRTLQLQCCHSECIGGCTGPIDSDCMACVHVFHNGRCLDRCPVGTYQYRGRRCLTQSECRELNFAEPGQPRQYWKPLNDSRCLLKCPPGFIESNVDRHTCILCDGGCPKVCPSQIVDSIASAQLLHGCTIIQGVLEIQIRGGDQIGVELEKNLGLIEEITDYLKIVRSYALLSLRFLKKLRVIGGERLQNDKYALYFLDNENLQDIWDFKLHPNLTIRHGLLFLHFNRKLCLNKINELVKFTGLQGKMDETDISPTNNGDQVACEITAVDLTLVGRGAQFAILRWNKFNMSDERQLLSWVINIRQTNDENVTIYDARDACSTNGLWKVIDHPIDFAKETPFTATILSDLQPFTKYAVYVQTYTIMTAKMGARSSILYFTTQPEVPTPAREVNVEARFPGELHVTWQPPSKPNGNVTHYYVYWNIQPLLALRFKERNYCEDKLRLVSKSKMDIIVDNNINNNRNETMNNSSTSTGLCCKCPKSQEQIKIEDEERRFQIEFENFLQDTLYRKQPNQKNQRRLRKRFAGTLLIQSINIRSRRRRDVNPPNDEIHRLATQNKNYFPLLTNYTIQSNNGSATGLVSSGTVGNTAELSSNFEQAIVYGKTELIITNLGHFQEYSIEVVACHELAPGADQKLCSNRAIVTARTLPDAVADRIDLMNVSVTMDMKLDNGAPTGVLIQWKDPPSPNGLIVLYELELVKVDVANYKPEIYCIPYQQYINNSGYLAERLVPGNWSYRIRVTSLAGNGSWTELQYFYISRHDAANNVTLIVSVFAAAFVAAVVICVCFVKWYLKKKQKEAMSPEALYGVSPNPQYFVPEDAYTPDEWEVPRDKVKIIREIGQGSFGMVYEGIAEDLKDGQSLIPVAIKTTNEKASLRDRIAFLNEASVMKAFRCHHIVMLLGVVSDGQPTLVIMELMARGDLRNYLRMHRPDDHENAVEPLTLAQILQMAGEIADGMAYLASKKFVHRDLAARNCMVAEDLTVKIGDFGMTRDIYETDYYRKGTKGLLPIRWMAPESLKDGVFTSQSDVWSYGVVVWEMTTLAAQPYQGLSHEEVLKFVINGGSMVAPEGCPKRLFDIMKRCWRLNPKERPTFLHLLDDLALDMSEKFRQVAFYFNDAREDTTVATTEEDDDTEEFSMIRSTTPLARSESTPLKPSLSAKPESSATTIKIPPGGLHESPQKCINNSVDIASIGLESIDLDIGVVPITRGVATSSVTAGAPNRTTNHSLPDVKLVSNGNALPDVMAFKYNNHTDSNSVGNCSVTAVESNTASNSKQASSKSLQTNGHIPYDIMTSARC